MQPCIKSELGIFLLLLRQILLHVLLERSLTEIPLSSSWQMQILNSSHRIMYHFHLVITLHGCQVWIFHIVRLISYSSTPHSSYLSFIYFVVQIAFYFSILKLCSLPCSTQTFPFYLYSSCCISFCKELCSSFHGFK